MTKDKTKIIRLLAKIQNECGKINFNTNHGSVDSALNENWFSFVLFGVGGETVAGAHIYFKHDSEMLLAINKLQNTLADLQEYYKMNRIIVKKG